MSVHTLLSDETRHLIGERELSLMKPTAYLINAARGPIVDEGAVIAALDAGRLGRYLCDFPSVTLVTHPKVVSFPHLGASTLEAEENCAMMAVDSLRAFLENGEIRHSVNYPDATMPRANGSRLAICNANVPNMLGQISTVLAAAELNIIDMLNHFAEILASESARLVQHSRMQTMESALKIMVPQDLTQHAHEFCRKLKGIFVHDSR